MRILITLAVILALQACKHPLAIEGEGDIIERLIGQRGCTLEEFQANSPRCTENEVVDEDYIVSYEAVPRPGWRFVTWRAGTACSKESVAPYCEYNVPQALVAFMDEEFPGLVLPATVAVFGQPNTWTTKADTLTRGVGVATCAIGGKLYAVGLGWGAGLPNRVEEYDPATDTWTPRANMPTERAWLTASVVGDKCYVIGGGQGGFAPSLTTVEEYDPKTDSWRTRAPLPEGRDSPGSTVVDGKIYVVGGGDRIAFASGARAAVAIYDPSTDQWSTGADMPTPRKAMGVVAIDGFIYAVGGSNYDIDLVSADTVERYDPEKDAWTKRTKMPEKRHFLSASAHGGMLYAIGGLIDAGNSTSASVHRYDPQTNQWTSRADMSVPRYGAGSATLNGQILVVGGRKLRESVPLTSTEKYTP